MPVGAIKWFSPSKGYGFITRDDGVDVFVHYSGLAPDQDRRLFPGDRVEFEEAEGEKGRKAVGVRCVAPAGAEAPPDPQGAS
jgi:cold shock protein